MQYGPYLLMGQIVKRERPSSTKGPIGCVSLVYQLLVKLKKFENFFSRNQHSWVATYILDNC